VFVGAVGWQHRGLHACASIVGCELHAGASIAGCLGYVVC
jgi:hypothetical protein